MRQHIEDEREGSGVSDIPDIEFIRHPEDGLAIFNEPPQINEGDQWVFTDLRGVTWTGTFGKPQPSPHDGELYMVPIRYKEQG